MLNDVRVLRNLVVVMAGIFMPVNIFAQSTVSVDFQTEYQAIDGFGGYGGAGEFFYGPPSGYPDWYSDEFIDFMVDDMGQTVIRINMVGSFNYKEGVYDPDMHLPNFQNGGANSVYNESYTNLKNDGSYLNSSTKFVAAMDQKLRQNGDSLKLMLSLWSPPAWMKDNNDFMRGKLLPEHYGDFADFIVKYIQTYEANSGVKVYCLSLQNEPNLGHPQYTLGCVYTGEEYKAMVDSVHQKMTAAGIDHVRLIAPETVAFLDRMRNILNPFVGDTSAAPMIDMYCTHSYGGDGITLGSGTAAEWTQMRNFLEQLEPGNLWMSETGFNTNGWSGAMTDARRIFGALKFGQISSWIWWTNGHFRGMEKGYIGSDQLSYYSSKQFFRFIRPGAVQVKADCDNNDIGIIAFSHKSRGELTVVMLNNGNDVEEVSFTNEIFPGDWRLYRSSSTEKCVDYGEASGKTFTLPANSITTIVHTSGIVPPGLNDIGDLTILKNSGEQTLDLTGIVHGSGTANDIIVSASSSDHTLVNDPLVEYTSPEPTGSIHFTPHQDQSGTAEISVVVTDTPGAFYGMTAVSFRLKVLDEINVPPVMNLVPDTTLVKGTTFHTIELTGLDDGNEANQHIEISAVSSDRNTVRVVEVSGTSLVLYAKNLGEADITVTLKDDGGTELGGIDQSNTTFTVEVVESVTGLTGGREDEKFRIFPNPTEGVFHVSGLPDGAIVSLYDLTGTALEPAGSGRKDIIDITDSPPGVYYLKVTNSSGGSVRTDILVKTAGR